MLSGYESASAVLFPGEVVLRRELRLTMTLFEYLCRCESDHRVGETRIESNVQLAPNIRTVVENVSTS